jgi:hypothetical protein
VSSWAHWAGVAKVSGRSARQRLIGKVVDALICVPHGGTPVDPFHSIRFPHQQLVFRAQRISGPLWRVPGGALRIPLGRLSLMDLK